MGGDIVKMLLQFWFQHGGCSSCLCSEGRREWLLCVCTWGGCWQLTAAWDRRVSEDRKAQSRADGVPDEASPITSGHRQPTQPQRRDLAGVAEIRGLSVLGSSALIRVLSLLSSGLCRSQEPLSLHGDPTRPQVWDDYSFPYWTGRRWGGD